jgi:hypothetical protein
MRTNHKYILVGNKLDLVKQREVGTDEAIAMATNHGMNYVELSSIKSECSLIRLPFLIVAKQLIDEGICRPSDTLTPRKGIRLTSSTTPSSYHGMENSGGGVGNVNDNNNNTNCCNTS